VVATRIAMLVSAAALMSHGPAATARTTGDLPDEVSGKQIHAVYVLPSDGVDRQLDTNGTIPNEIASFQGWLAGQTPGNALRVDEAAGKPDVTFFRLSRTDAEVASRGAFVRDEIEAELRVAGFDAPDKIYAVWYDGGSSYACGGGAYPPSLPGNVAAMYLRGRPPGAVPCDYNPFAPAGGPPGYLQFSMLHEVLHTIGIVPGCAPHQVLAGHASDSPLDLMYAGDQAWYPSVLDIGRDDYFDAHIPNCLDLATSGWLAPAAIPPRPPAPTPGQSPPRPPPAEAVADRTDPVVSVRLRRGRTKNVVRLGVVSVVVGCPAETCTATAGGTVSVPQAARLYRLRSATKRIAKGATARLRLRFSKQGLRAVRRAVRKRKSLKIKVRVVATDAAGNSAVRKRAIRLRR
jgi:hypothetical protein